MIDATQKSIVHDGPTRTPGALGVDDGEELLGLSIALIAFCWVAIIIAAAWWIVDTLWAVKVLPW